MSKNELRIAHTEALFRDVNERIAESAERYEAEFVCECSDAECAERIPAALEEYESVRANSTHFLLVPGHEDTRVERVAERPHMRTAVVEKFHVLVASTVRSLDPRTDGA
jgi:hypothetical protein